MRPPTTIPLLFILLLLAPAVGRAQSSDFGTEYSLSYAIKPWKGGELSLGQELRFKDNSRRFAKSETSLDLQHALFRKPLKRYQMRLRIGGGYHFIYRQNASFYSYPQHRLILQETLSKDWGSMRLGFRTRFQSTLRDPRLGDYKVNPQQQLRLRLSLRYSLPDSPWQFDISHEGFVSLTAQPAPLYDEYRTQLCATRSIGKHQSVTIYAKCSQELQVPAPETYYCLGLSLDFD